MEDLVFHSIWTWKMCLIQRLRTSFVKYIYSLRVATGKIHGPAPKPVAYAELGVSATQAINVRVAILRPLRTYIRLKDLCDGTLRGQLYSMCMCMSPRARHGWECTVPVSICVVSECYASWCITCTSFANYTARPFLNGSLFYFILSLLAASLTLLLLVPNVT